jgi:hypothetical protein
MVDHISIDQMMRFINQMVKTDKLIYNKKILHPYIFTCTFRIVTLRGGQTNRNPFQPTKSEN